MVLPLALSDTVTLRVTPAASTTISCACPGHTALDGPRNLAARAADRLLAAGGLTARVEIVIHKRIWTAAGLGGGSSDAAAVLLALSRLLDLDMDLLPIALDLGADVPFFLDPGPARVIGVGAARTLLAPFPRLDLVLLNPGTPLSTARVFAALDLGGQPPRPPRPPTTVDPRRLPRRLANDLAAPAAHLCPRIEQMHRALLRAGAHSTGLSGSGPTVFGVFRDPTAARAAARNISDTTELFALATCSLPARNGAGTA